MYEKELENYPEKERRPWWNSQTLSRPQKKMMRKCVLKTQRRIAEFYRNLGTGHK